FLIQVDLSADGGFVLDHSSVFVHKTLRKPGDCDIHLANWHIPWGIYRYHIQCGEKTTDGVVYVGTAEKDWLKKIRQQRKNEVFEHNIERVGFIKTADHVGRVTAKLVQAVDQPPLTLAAWRSFYRGWRMEFNRIHNSIMSHISDRNRENYLHPMQWIALRDLRTDIDHTSK